MLVILRVYCEINLWHFLCQGNLSKESKILMLDKKDNSQETVFPSKFVSERGINTLQNLMLIKYEVKRYLLNKMKKDNFQGIHKRR